jgi:hypothetical protein
VTATAVWLSDRYGALASDPQGEPVIGRVPANLDLGVAVTWRDAWVRGLDVGAAVHDLLDAGSLYVVPYRPVATTHPPTPGASREVMVRVAYGAR